MLINEVRAGFMNKLIVTSIILGAIVAGNALVQAQNIAPETTQQQELKVSVKNADYIFQGVVTKVEYQVSEPSQIPHTFVTFRVEKFIEGGLKQEFVTLRFVGGPDNKGRFLIASGVPLFDVGDRDILLVRDNGKSACPLVGCAEGRFRVINNQVFSDDGRTILIGNLGQLFYGKPQQLEGVLSNKIGNVVVRDVPSNNETNLQDSSGNNGAQVDKKENSLPSLLPNQLELLIKNQALQLSRTGELQPRQFNVSVDRNAKFSIPLPKPVAPPQIAAPGTKFASPANEAERRELEMLQQNQGNPVFPNSKPKP